MSLEKPIEAGRYYRRGDKIVGRARLARPTEWAKQHIPLQYRKWQVVGDGGHDDLSYFDDYGMGAHMELECEVFIVTVDPADVVAELRHFCSEARTGVELGAAGAYGMGVAKGLADATDFVAEKLRVTK